MGMCGHVHAGKWCTKKKKKKKEEEEEEEESTLFLVSLRAPAGIQTTATT